jgi:uncharacterized repeat protein (TIGR01451 family)
LLAVSVLQNFPDINFNQTGISTQYTPPDTMMAVGPTTVVGAVNTAIVLKDKGGTTLAGPTQFSTFFRSILRRGDGFSDPYVLYDDQAQRYYVGILEYPSTATTGYFDFAVSNSSTPTGLNIGSGTGDWKVFSQITSVNEGGTQFPDFPKMGWNNDAVFVSFNQFQGGAFFSHDLVLAISKSSIQAGGPLSTFQTDVSTGSDTRILIPARMHGSAAGTEYFVQKDSEGTVNGTVNVVAESGYLTATPGFATSTIAVNSYSSSPGVPGLTSQIDDRMLSADWVNNKLVAAQDVGVGGLNLARWYEFDTTGTTPALVPGQQGDISPGPGTLVSTSYPSIAVNPSGDIGMTYIQSSSSQPYSMYVTGRLASDTPGAMQPGLETAAGASPVPGALRGGDYSATEYDPVNTGQFWSANEYNLDSSGSNFHWGTQIANFTLGTTTPTNADLSVIYTGPATGTDEGGNVTYTFRVTNAGPDAASGAVLTDTLGPNLRFVSATTSQGTFTQSGGVVTFSLGTVAASGSVTVTVTAQSTEDGTLTDTASVSSNATDPNLNNNNASATTMVAEGPAIVVSGPINVSGKKVNNATVATFTHANGVELASAFIATINWGDGTTSQGTITLSGTTYTVKGSHTYGKPGSYTVTTTVTEANSSPNIAVAAIITTDSGDAAASLSGPSNTSDANLGDQTFVAPVDSGEQGLDLQGNETTASGKRKPSST